MFTREDMNIVSVTYLKFLFKWVRVSLNYAIIMKIFWPWSANNLHEAYEAEFLSKLSSTSTLPFSGLQLMQQCQGGWILPLSLSAPSC